MKNGLYKIVTKSEVVTKFNVTKSRLQCAAHKKGNRSVDVWATSRAKLELEIDHGHMKHNNYRRRALAQKVDRTKNLSNLLKVELKK